MKTLKIVCLIFCILFSNSVFSQDIIISYFNSEWKKVKNHEKATYFRKAYCISKNNWVIKDFYMDGTLQMEGSSKNKKLKKRNGLFRYYYKNGGIKTKGEYFKDEKAGIWKTYYEDGNLKSSVNFAKGKYNGTCEWFHKSGNVASKEKYLKGELKELIFWDERGNKLKGELKVIEKPKFPGGEDGIRKFVAKELKYPADALSKHISGRVFVRFEVDISGKVSKTEIRWKIYPSLDKEALRVVERLPRFKPGKKHNLPENLWFVIPILFNTH